MRLMLKIDIMIRLSRIVVAMEAMIMTPRWPVVCGRTSIVGVWVHAGVPIIRSRFGLMALRGLLLDRGALNGTWALRFYQRHVVRLGKQKNAESCQVGPQKWKWTGDVGESLYLSLHVLLDHNLDVTRYLLSRTNLAGLVKNVLADQLIAAFNE
jgi:hypothetical protein